MRRLRNLLRIYLVISSVILHCVVVAAVIFLAPAIKAGSQWAEDIARASAGKPANTGVVMDISTLTEGDYTYVGYSLDYKGQALYVMGAAPEGIRLGDKVAVDVSKHPYGPLKSLMVMVTKIGR